MELQGIFTEEWMNAIYNGVEEGIIIANENFKIRSINKVGEEITGWKYDEIKDKELKQVFRQMNGADYGESNSFNEFSNINDVYSTSFLINKNKNELLVERKVVKIKGFSGAVTAYIIFFKGAGDEKIRINDLRENERKYKGLFDNALEGIFILDDNANIIDANPAACQVYQLKKAILLKLTIRDVFPHKSDEEFFLIWSEFRKTGFIDGFYKYKLNNGEERYIDFRARTNFLPGLHLAVFSDVTEKTRTEKALKNSEANLKAIFNNTNQRIILLDMDYRVVTANVAAQKAAIEGMGYELKEGDNIFDYANTEDKAKNIAMCERAKEGETVFFEINPKFPLKPDYWLEVGFIPVFDNKKVVKGICLTTTDITYRKKTELNLTESEARFRSLVQNSSDIITILDENTFIKYTSSSAEKIFGYKEEDLLSKQFLDFIHEDDRPIARNIFKKIYSGGGYNPVIEFRLKHADGYYLYVETTCNNLLSNEYIKGVVLNTRDITERKFQEENLLLLERAIDSSNNGIIISDPNRPDNPIIYANKAFENITGYDYLDIIGKNCRYLQREDKDQPEVERMKNAIRNQKEISVILRNYKKDGTLFWNELDVSPVFNRNGELTNFIGVITDITERKQAEDTLLDITQGVSGSDEKDIYASLVKHIAISLQMEFVVIGELLSTEVIKAKAFWKDGMFVENMECKLENTPCGDILEKGHFYAYDNVIEKFPLDAMLVEEKINSYMGVPLIDSTGKKIGVLMIMSRKPFPNKLLSESILNIFSVKASVELERDYYIAALKGSEKKFRDLAKNSPDLIYIIDLDQKQVIYFNRSEILGYNSLDLSASDAWLNIVHPDDIERVKNHWAKFLESSVNITSSVECRVRSKSNEYEWITNRHIVLERNADGHPKQVLLNLTIITESKKAEDALRESKVRLMALIENTNDIMWSVDKVLFFTTMNSAFKNLLKDNYKKNIDVGDNLKEVLPADLKDEWLNLHERALAGERFSVEFNVNNKSKNLSYEVSYNPIYSDEGDISGVSVFARDITQRKLAENHIIRTNFELDSFVYRASHDLRAPLRSVLGLVNLAKTESDVKERNTYLQLVEKSVNKLDTFISDLTNFSRNSRLEINLGRIDFQSILNECLENLKYMDNAKRINTIINIKENVEYYSDSTRISIILQNMISNSIKYQNLRVDDSFVKIDISTEKDYAEIIISDNGKGIKEEYLDKIFDMFFRASQESYGSGLGLYITKQVVEKLNGNISVSSKLGLGSEFVFRLPNYKK